MPQLVHQKSSGHIRRRRIWLEGIRFLFLERLELNDASAVEPRIDDFEVKTLCGGTNKKDRTSFHLGQECILFCIVPKLSFVREFRRAQTQQLKTPLRFSEFGSQGGELGLPGVHDCEMEFESVGDDM